MNNDPLEEEAKIIERFDGMTNPKKIVALAKKIYMTEASTPIQKTLCVSIANAKDHVKHLDFCRRRISDCFVLIEQLIEDGNHGMIIHNKIVYGVAIDTRANWLEEGKQWTPEDEADIQDKLISAWMDENKVTKFTGKIVLFPKFGFSGVPMLLVH